MANMTGSTGTDILIIGSGAAGLTLALRAAKFAKVAVLSKGNLREGATFYAQGGIAAVLDEKDSIESHTQDTLNAGVGLCDPRIVEHIVSRSAKVVEWLVNQGVPFTTIGSVTNNKGETTNADTELSSLHLTQEGGHSHRRIIHATDATGKAVFETLQRRAIEHPNISLIEGCTAVDLVTQELPNASEKICVGVYALNQKTTKVELISAKFVALATGGASKTYLFTTNPDGASGDGIAMAWRAGCRVANMEFNQFHPTCLYHPHAKSFLISEALRGEGAKLELPDGTRFMEMFDTRGDLAPRDIVARAIDHEMKRLGCDCVYLNINDQPSDFVMNNFPNIYNRCLEFGIDITRDRIPVVPAAHYTCGGIIINEHGETDIKNLYAIGETSCSGLHGANRMASNSLLECFVVAFGAARNISEKIASAIIHESLPAWDESRVTDSDDEILVSHNWDEIRRLMWDFVGIVRSTKRLKMAERRITVLREEIRDYYVKHKVTNDNLELRNLALVAELIINCALQRKESRGLHYTLDFPETLEEAEDNILNPNNKNQSKRQ